MADDGALGEQAWAAAEAIVDTYMTFEDPESDEAFEARRQMIAMTAVGWIEGRQAGGNEAMAVLRRFQENL